MARGDRTRRLELDPRGAGSEATESVWEPVIELGRADEGQSEGRKADSRADAEEGAGHAAPTGRGMPSSEHAAQPTSRIARDGRRHGAKPSDCEADAADHEAVSIDRGAGLNEHDAKSAEHDAEQAQERGRADLLARARVRLEGLGARARPPAWDWPELAGRLSELSAYRGGPALTLALTLVRDAQRRGERAVWVTARRSCFYPPDAQELGVALEALVVVRPPTEADVPVAGEWLARCGTFGLVVLDLGTRAQVPMPLQSRLATLAQRHDLAVLCLTEKDSTSASLSSLVSLRAHTRLRRRAVEQFECELEVHKDKRRSRPWRHVEVVRGAPGLR